MADELTMAVADVLRKGGVEQDECLREGVRVLAEALMEMELEERPGAERQERLGNRNGRRERTNDTRVGSIELEGPRVLRDASFFPSMLDPQQAERALMAVVQEAFVQGASPRRMDDLVHTLGVQGLSKSQIGRLCTKLDKEVAWFRTRRLEGGYTNVELDGTFVDVRKGGGAVSQAVVIAVGVTSGGERELLGLGVGPTEGGDFWLAFLRGLVARGLSGVGLAIGEAPVERRRRRRLAKAQPGNAAE